MKSNRPKKSDVWKYYEIDAEDDSSAVCNLCNPPKIISRGSKLKGPQCYGTSALWAHLKLSHKQEYSSLEKCPSYPSRLQLENKQQRLLAKPNKVRLNTAKEDQTYFRIKKPKLNQTEERLTETSEHEEYLNLIGQMIALDNQPVSIVDDEGFRRMLKVFLPSCNELDSLYFGNHVLPQIYLTTRKKILSLLQQTDYLTFSVDVDQNVFKTETLMVISATWIDNNCNRANVILGTNLFPTYPSHKIVDSIFQETLKEWYIDRSKVHLVIHPYAQKNMTYSLVIPGLKNETYFQHLIQLLIEDTVLSQSRVTRVLDLCRNLISYSTETRETLDLLNILHNVPLLERAESELLLDTNSNWMSSYRMLLSIKKNKEDINNITTLNHALSIANEDWLIISQTLDVLEPIYEIMKSITPVSNHLSSMIPYMAIIQRYFNTNPSTFDSEISQDVKQAICKKVYDDYQIEARECLVLATVFDPRYKLSFLSEQGKQNSNKWLIELQSNPQPDFNCHTVKQELSEKKDIWSCFNEIADEKTELPRNENSFHKELNEYLNARLLDREHNPLDWWRANKDFFPSLFSVGKRFLSPPMDSLFFQNKKDNLLIRLRRSVDEDEQPNSLLDINQRLFLHFNLLNFQK